jgi:plastocyanin
MKAPDNQGGDIVGTQRTIWRHLAVAAALATAVACGGGGGPTGPSGGGGGGGGSGPGPVGATITIGANGVVSPNSVTVNVGQSVTFVNSHNVFHDMSSDPHPAHTDCPAVNVGGIAPGASRTTNAFPTARTCSFHDHNDDTNPNLRGSIIVR